MHLDPEVSSVGPRKTDEADYPATRSPQPPEVTLISHPSRSEVRLSQWDPLSLVLLLSQTDIETHIQPQLKIFAGTGGGEENGKGKIK